MKEQRCTPIVNANEDHLPRKGVADGARIPVNIKALLNAQLKFLWIKGERRKLMCIFLLSSDR